MTPSIVQRSYTTRLYRHRFTCRIRWSVVPMKDPYWLFWADSLQIIYLIGFFLTIESVRLLLERTMNWLFLNCLIMFYSFTIVFNHLFCTPIFITATSSHNAPPPFLSISLSLSLSVSLSLSLSLWLSVCLSVFPLNLTNALIFLIVMNSRLIFFCCHPFFVCFPWEMFKNSRISFWGGHANSPQAGNYFSFKIRTPLTC